MADFSFAIHNLLWIMIFAILLSGCTNKQNDHAETYTCPMHPTVVSDKPGTCPVCGMNLVLKTRPSEAAKDIEDLNDILGSPNESIISSIKTIKGQYKSIPVSIDAKGVVTYDPVNMYTIPSRVSGRLEKIYLKYAFQQVKKGQKIADIYSPELITAQRDLLFLVSNDAENKPLINATKDKLERLGLSASQMQNVIEKKAVSNAFSLYSPYNGYLITDQQAPSTSVVSTSPSATSNEGMGTGMGSKLSDEQSSSIAKNNSPGTTIKEGSYVSVGQTLFSIANTEALRIELNIPAQQLSTLKKGDKVALDYKNGNREEGVVDFIQPFFDKDQDFIKIRVNTKNIKDLHIGHLVNAKISLSPTESLWLPREAVLDVGSNRVVFMKEGKTLKPKKISTGITSQGLIEIKSGIASTDEIAANAQYLVDSESFIKTTK